MASANAPTPEGLRLASLAPPSPEPTLRLTAHGSFDAAAVRAGDTIRYRLRVEWEEIPAAVMLLPRDHLEAQGLHAVGSSTVHRKTSSGGAVQNITEYTYTLVALEPGAAKIPAFPLRYHNGLTGREETVSVPGSVIEIAPARVPLTQRTGIRVFALLAAILVLVELGRRARARRPRQQEPDADAAPPTLTAGLRDLKARCERADSRVWIADAEKLCTLHLCRLLGITNPENVRFEAALDRYLDRNRDIPPEVMTSWITLRDLFHEARYAGPKLEPHELHAAHRHLNTCLQPGLRTSQLKEGVTTT